MRRSIVVVMAMFLSGMMGQNASVKANTILETICRVKGQEENILIGQGLVVGLKGTGDGDSLPTGRALATSMSLLGIPLGSDGLKELKSAKNVALVQVSVTIPASGAREGDRFDCVVSSALSAKSLAGGRLFLTPLVGPEARMNPRVYAMAQGPITLDDPAFPTSGRIHGGCRMEEDFNNAFYTKAGKFTLVLDENHRGFRVAQEVADLINSQTNFQNLAKALNPANIEVTILPQYMTDEDPVDFISMILELKMVESPPVTPRVTINERAKTIVIGEDVEIGAVAVTVNNISIETGTASINRFVPVAPGIVEPPPKLKSLVENLNAIQAPQEDIISVIKEIAACGKLHGQLIIK